MTGYIMRFSAYCLVLFSLAGWAVAQENTGWSHIDGGVGAGFTAPQGPAGNNLNTGWNIDARGGYKPFPHLALDLDFNYNRWNLNGASLARYGELAGFTTIWSASFLPVWYGPSHWHISPYVMGGPGVYYRNLSLNQPALINTSYCDPFFGFCYPATVGVNQVVASSTTYKMGINGGAGLEFPMGDTPLKVFGEARYSRMFATHGYDLWFVPVTFGIRW